MKITEAAYFFEADGDRVTAFIVDMKSANQIPYLVEPLFQGKNAKVELHPVMLFDGLKQALSKYK
ncbi:MAG TPA: hypothetical protein VIP56_07660 [Nitrososphaeraceae archaeon]